MRAIKIMLSGLLFAFAVSAMAQTIKDADDGTTLKQIVIYGRHSVRSSVASPEQLADFAVDTYPAFEVAPGMLTPRGWQAELRLGAYFREYLLHEGLLTGNTQEDSERSYFRANSIERSQYTAAAFQLGAIPGVGEPVVHSFPIGQVDPVFDPISAGVATVDTERALAEVNGIFNNGEALPAAYSGEYSLVREVLLGPGPTPKGKIDVTALPIRFTSVSTPKTGKVIDPGGLFQVTTACDPFIMQYADNFPMENVGWGKFEPNTLSQQTRTVGLFFDIQFRSPHLSQTQGSNSASHVLRTLKQAASGQNLRGAFGNAKSRLNVIISSDDYVIALASLLNLHWQLRDYQPNFCAPGGALVFELRQVNKSKKRLVRVFYTAQTLDQLRELKTLSLTEPPSTMRLFVPDGSPSPTNLDVDFNDFQKLLKKRIATKYVQKTSKEVQPGLIPITDIPTAE